MGEKSKFKGLCGSVVKFFNHITLYDLSECLVLANLNPRLHEQLFHLVKFFP